MTTPKAPSRDERFMAQAIALAERAAGRTHPNPLVGCVIVRGEEIIGEGFHKKAGTDHAEVAAIKDAAGDLRGCELYVNHEPCCHVGRTPPCTDAILKAGISRVVVGTVCPDPRVSGQGLRLLREAGLEVVSGVLEEESRQLNGPFFTYHNENRPLVAAKWAMSLDGKIAAHTGHSRWITGEEARRHAHGLRNTFDAILVGTGTLLADNPRLTCRIEGGRDPVRFVIDTALKAPLDHAIFNLTDSTAPTVVLTSEDADPERLRRFEDHGVTLRPLPVDESGRLSPEDVLRALSEHQLLSVLVEGGGTLLGSLFDARYVDYLYAYVAPRIIGGRTAPAPIQGLGVAAVTDALSLRAPRIEHLGADLLIHGELSKEPAPEET